MKNSCQKIKIIDSASEKTTVEFLESGIVMPLSKSILKEKIKNGFYQVVHPTF